MATVRMIRPNYVIQFFIGKIDLTMRVEDVIIINSIKTVYPVILVKLNFSSKDYFLEKLYGQEDGKLLITLTGEETEPRETTEIELIIVHMKNNVSMQKNTEENNESNQVDDTITAVALMKKPYIAFSSTVNFIFSDSGDKTSEKTNIIDNIRNDINNIVPALDINESISGFVGVSNPKSQLANTINNTIGDVVNPISNTVNNVSNIINNTSNLINNATNLIDNFTDRPFSSINRIFNIIDDRYSELNNYIRMANNISNQLNNITTFLVDTGGFGSVQVGNFSKKILTDQVKKLKNKATNLSGRQNSNPKKNTPAYVVNTLFDKYIDDIDKNLYFDNINNTEIKELVIPPRSLIGCIRYINDRYGIYKGPLMVFAGIDNQLDMWDISKAADQDILYTVDFLAAGSQDSEIFSKSMDGDSNFYTYMPLKIKNATNTNVMNKGFEHIVVKRPRNKFSEITKKTLDDVTQIFKTTKDSVLICNKDVLKKNISVHTNVNANSNEDDPDEAYLTSKMTSYIASCSTFTFNIEGTKLPLQKLSKVGSCIQLIPHVTEYLQYGGKYIVGSSAIKLSRTAEHNYKCYAEITCFRESLESQPDPSSSNSINTSVGTLTSPTIQN